MNILSTPFRLLRNVYLSLLALYTEISTSNKTFNALISRISNSPGLPVPNPTTPLWLEDPPFPELCDVRSEGKVPERAHVVVIGSGISGAAVAWSLLRGGLGGEAMDASTGGVTGQKKVVMLEARSVCSGATGRNGGHVKVSPWEVIQSLKFRGITGERARKFVDFQRRHLDVLLELCGARGFEAAELREVETVDLFVDMEGWEETRGLVERLGRENGLEGLDWGLKLWEGEEAREVSCFCRVNNIFN
jgi:hypothetical protein